DDPPPTISINDASIVEGNTGTNLLVFTVSLSAPSGKNIYVSYATADDTATTADQDYQAASGGVYFGINETSHTISVAINGDRRIEPNETFFINLSLNAPEATIQDGIG